MLNGKANQLTEMVPIARIFGSITNFVSKNATSLFVLNVSDLLPYVLGILANFRAIYSPELYSCNINATGDCDGKAASFIADFAVSTFHVDASDANVCICIISVSKG